MHVSMSGVAAVKGAAAAARTARNKGVLAGRQESQSRADFMRLAKKGDPKGRVIYTLGGGAQYNPDWVDAAKEQQDEWRALITAAADAVSDTLGSCDC